MYRSTALMIGTCVSILSFGIVNAQEKTREYRADSIEVLSNSGTMRYRSDYVVTQVTGVVGKAGIPDVIKQGDTITVQDRTLRASFIFVTECLVEMKWGGQVLCAKGQIQCLVVERLEDIPSDTNDYRLWITVDHCRPSFLKGTR